ncbi:MAG TPA: hypothetical protein VHL53_08830 [Acidimicrobiia bacterium]|nr:hypothetical protein [Acidimicrobiia bacterium]
MNRLRGRRSIGRRALCLAGATAIAAPAVLGLATNAAGGEEAPPPPTSYEAVASAEGVRISFGAPGFVAVDTFVDGGGPVSQSVIDGLGNSRAFASLPYPGDLAISGPGLLAGLTGLPSPPPYPFYVSSSHPTAPEGKMAAPGYSLNAKSAEASSEGQTMTGQASGGQGGSAVGSTVTDALTKRDPNTGQVSAVATGTADVINIGGVLRIGQVAALAKVTRTPGADPTREASFAINGMTIAGQTVGFSDKGFTFGGTNVPLPKDNPLLAALAQAKITVQYVNRVDNPDGVVSPGLVITQQQATPGGPTMVFRYVFGQMSASATVSGSSTSIGADLPALDTGPAPTQEISPPPAAPDTTTTDTGAALPAGSADTGGYGSDGGAAIDYGTPSSPATTPVSDAPVATAPSSTNLVQEAAPISRTPMTLVDTASVYLILVAGAAVAFVGGTVLRLLGVKLKWTS